jgi:hypothetical protein
MPFGPRRDVVCVATGYTQRIGTRYVDSRRKEGRRCTPQIDVGEATISDDTADVTVQTDLVNHAFAW